MTIDIQNYICDLCGGDHPTEAHPQEEITKESWEKRYGHQERPAYPEGTPPHPRFLELFNAYKKEIPERGKVLDLGCGNGRNLLEVARQGYQTYGLELSTAAIFQLQQRLEKQNLKAEIQQGSFLNPPYPKEYFDCIISWNSLQHNNWESAQKSFSEVGQLLKKNGLFMLMVRSTKRFLESKRKDIGDESGLGGFTYIPQEGSKQGVILHHYSESEIRKLAEDNKLEIVRDDSQNEEIKEVIRFKGDLLRRAQWSVVFRKKTD